jgi:hypothetical protein
VTIPRALGSVVVGAVALIGLVLSTADPFTFVFYLAYVGVSVALLARQPGNVIAWLLMGIGFAFLTTTTPGLDVESLKDGTAEPATWIRAWAASWGGTLSYVGFVALAIIFPSGRLPAGLRGRLALGMLAACVAVVAVMAVAPTMVVNPDGIRDEVLPNPFAVAPDAAIWASLPPGSTGMTIIPVFAALAVAAISLVVRYRRATGILRLQLRWLVASISALVIGLLFGLSVAIVIGQAAGNWAWIPVILAFPMVPIAIGIAVSRYRLFEIDRLISRSIGYALVTVTLFALFAIVNLGAQAVLAPFVRGGTVAVAISTLAVAATFNPLRVRLQRLVDRRFNRARYDQERTLVTFADGLRQDLDMDRLVAHIRGTVEAAVEPRSMTVWRRDETDA